MSQRQLDNCRNLNISAFSTLDGFDSIKNLHIAISNEGVDAYVCPKCGEVILEGKDANMLQKLSKSFSEMEGEQKPDILNLTEVADLLRVTNQTIYNIRIYPAN